MSEFDYGQVLILIIDDFHNSNCGSRENISAAGIGEVQSCVFGAFGVVVVYRGDGDVEESRTCRDIILRGAITALSGRGCGGRRGERVIGRLGGRAAVGVKNLNCQRKTCAAGALKSDCAGAGGGTFIRNWIGDIDRYRRQESTCEILSGCGWSNG